MAVVTLFAYSKKILALGSHSKVNSYEKYI